MEKIIVTNIEWDTDGEYIPELPTEVSMDKWTDDEEEILESIADILFVTYDYDVVDFEIHYGKEQNKMKNLITLKIELTSSEANTLCSVLAKAIDYYTHHQDTETVYPVWLWGVMQDLSTAMYEQNVRESEKE